MNRKAFLVFLMVVLPLFGLGSCLSKNSLDWDGVYIGTIPSASGSGIDVCIKLNKDNTYELTYEYIDKPENSFDFTGKFTWDSTGNIIHIDIADAPSYYKVTKNKLIQLDMEGKPITGKLAENYVLRKEI